MTDEPKVWDNAALREHIEWQREMMREMQEQFSKDAKKISDLTFARDNLHKKLEDKMTEESSLRDWFAGQALAAMGEMICKHDSPDELMKRPERVAKWAFAYADAMLAFKQQEETV